MKPMRRAKGVVKPKMNLGLKFFKLISTSAKMVIPSAVIRQMPRVDRVVLRDRYNYNNIWVVEVDINGDNEWSFKKGWPSFYEDNCLKPFDIIVFDYKGGSTYVFDVTIMGQNGCQKKGLAKLRIKEECEVEEIEHFEIFSDGGSDGGSDDDPNDDDWDMQEEKELQQDRKSKKGDSFDLGVATRRSNIRPFFLSRLKSQRSELFIPKKVIVDYKLKLPERLFLVDVRGNKWETVVKIWKNGRICCAGGGWRSLCGVNNINHDDTCICEFILEGRQDPCILVRVVGVSTTGSTSRRATKKEGVSNCYGDDILKQGLKNGQLFVSRTRSWLHGLMIPKKVIEDYKLKLPDVLLLVDERGNRWKTKTIKWKDGRVCCTQGWRSLCHVNNIKTYDTCICEFYLQSHHPRILVRLVHVTI